MIVSFGKYICKNDYLIFFFNFVWWVWAGQGPRVGAAAGGGGGPRPWTHTPAKLVGEEKKIQFIFCNLIFLLFT